MTTVGLISDTHGHLPEAAIDALARCERIIHAGDIGGQQVLWELETLAPVCAVLGNNDRDDYGPAVNPIAYPVIDEVQFVVVHEPQHLRRAILNAKETHPGFGGPLIGVYGHRHIPFLEVSPTSYPCDLVISPGAVFRSRDELGRRCVAFVEVDQGRVMDAQVTDLAGNVIYHM